MDGGSSVFAPPLAGGASGSDRGSASPRSDSFVNPSTIASVRSEKSPISSLSTVDLPSLVRNANSSREMRSRAR
jgi:hypothetical protein